MRRETRMRLWLTLGGAAALWLLLLGRGAQLALLRHDEYAALVKRQQTQIREIPALRGVILDRAGRTLACSLENESVALKLGPRADRTSLAEALVEAGLWSRERADEIRGEAYQGFLWVDRGWIDENRVAPLEARFSELRRVPEMKRFYPAGPVAPDLLGVVGVEGHGLSGIEWRFNTLLSGKPGQLIEFVTGGGLVENAPPPRVLVQPKTGGGLQLTLDARIQEIARHRLQEALVGLDSADGFVIVMDPATGEILALHEEPSFDPLRPRTIRPGLLKTACFTDQYEPGSTFKIVPFAAALEAGVVSPADTFYCFQGVRLVGGCRIRDHRSFDFLTVAEILALSSNIGAGRIAERVGWEGCYRMAQALGFGQVTGIAIGGEPSGYLPHRLSGSWSERSLVTAAYGQEVACTGLQMALAYSAIANDGVLVKPMLVKAQLDASGRVVKRHHPHVVRRAMSPETAHSMRTLLRQVVTDGTGRGAAIPWFPPAGKTGTAQVYNLEAGTYDPDEHVLSFMGFAPYDHPLVTCVVAVRCRGDAHASDVAVPIFAEIVKDLVWLLEGHRWAGTAPAGSEPPRVQVPDVRGLTPQAARRALHRVGLVPVLSGWGGRVEEVAPRPYCPVETASIVHLSLGGPFARDTVQVPDVRGLSLRRAAYLLGEAGLRVGVRGHGWVVRQDPEPGSVVERSVLCVACASPARSRARDEAMSDHALACETQ